MEYFVYENWTLDRGRIHKATCSFCNYGTGRGVEDSGRNGKWHGPYELDAAYAKANSLDRKEMKPCGHCKP